MTKRLQAIGNSSGLIIDKPILELLEITADTELEISTDGKRLIITPLRDPETRRQQIERIQEKTLKDHEQTFRRLAE